MIIKVYRLFQALSLDIAIGAVILSTAVAKYYGVSLTWPIQLCLFIAVWLIYTFDHLMAAAFIVIYFLLVRFTVFWAKEVFVALGYTAGVFLAPLALLSKWPVVGELWLVPCVFLVALINLLLFSLYDYGQDKQNGFHSVVLRIGTESSRKLIGLLLMITFSLVVWLLTKHPAHLLFWVLLVMTGSLVALHLRPTVFHPRDNYRILGDGIFFLPLVYLIYA